MKKNKARRITIKWMIVILVAVKLATAAMELLYDLHINVWIARAAGAIVAGMLGLLLQHILPHEKRAAD